MKQHILSLSSTGAALDNPQTLHIRCGHDLQQGLEQAGFVGDYLAFYDPFCQGPVADLPLTELKELRARFAAEAYQLPLVEARQRADESYAVLEQLANWQHLVLWFEHDSYNQLILAFLLSYLKRQQPAATIELICVDQVPGAGDFIGLGQLDPALFRHLWQQRQAVSAAALNQAEQVWCALCASKPNALEALIDSTPALPFMSAAIARHLQELPSQACGLSLTERLTLQLLAKHEMAAGLLFKRYQTEAEPLPWLGDVMHWSIVRSLATGANALVAIESRCGHWSTDIVSITHTGRKVLAGEQNWRLLCEQERYIGGVRIAPQSPSS